MVDWTLIAGKAFWGFALAACGGAVGGFMVALMTPPSPVGLLTATFMAWLGAGVAGAVEEGLRELLRQKGALQ